MNSSNEKLTQLLALIEATAQSEIDCDQSLDLLSGLADELRGDGSAASEARRISDRTRGTIEQHLRVCPDCKQELDALLAARLD